MVETTLAQRGITVVGITTPEGPQNKIVKEVCRRWSGQLIDFYTMNMDELAIIAKNRVLPVPTLLFFKNGRLHGRIVGRAITTVTDITNALSAIEEINAKG